MGTFPAFSLLSHFNNKSKLPLSPRKELVHLSSTLTCHPRNRSPNHLALIASRVCILESQRTIAYINAVFKWAWEHSHSFISRLSAEGIDKNAHFYFLSRRGLTAYFTSCYLGVHLLISLHLSDDCNLLFWDTDGSWHTLNSWEPLEQRCSSDNHKVWRGKQEPGTAWLMRYISYMRPLCHD